MKCLDDEFASYFQEETRVDRRQHIPDTRIHAVLYFIAPTGHGLKPLDIEVLKHIHDRCNVIPIIAKADTYTQGEASFVLSQTTFTFR